MNVVRGAELQRALVSLRDALTGAQNWRDSPSVSKQVQVLANVSRKVRDTEDLIGVASDVDCPKEERRVALRVLGRLPAKKVRKTLLDLLQCSDSEISFYAAEALRTSGSKADARTLIRILKTSPFPDSRAGSAWILHDVVVPLAAPVLQSTALQDQAIQVREAAVSALISYPSAKTYRTVTKCLDDPSLKVQEAAAFAAFCLGGRSGMQIAIPALSKLVRQKPERKEVQSLVEEARLALAVIRASKNNALRRSSQL